MQITMAAMSHRYESILLHCVFSTKHRQLLIPENLKKKLWAYVGGIARTNKFQALAVGGMPDHVHALLSIPASMAVAKAVQLIKGGSSKWINDHSASRSFAWQDSYGVFSIGISQVEETVRYINMQKEHHAKLSFPDEFRRFLKRHGLREYGD